MEKLIEEKIFAGESDMINQALIELIYKVEMEKKAEEKEKTKKIKEKTMLPTPA